MADKGPSISKSLVQNTQSSPPSRTLFPRVLLVTCSTALIRDGQILCLKQNCLFFIYLVRVGGPGQVWRFEDVKATAPIFLLLTLFTFQLTGRESMGSGRQASFFFFILLSFKGPIQKSHESLLLESCWLRT